MKKAAIGIFLLGIALAFTSSVLPAERENHQKEADNREKAGGHEKNAGKAETKVFFWGDPDNHVDEEDGFLVIRKKISPMISNQTEEIVRVKKDRFGDYIQKS